jgi:hypothetical protein
LVFVFGFVLLFARGDFDGFWRQPDVVASRVFGVLRFQLFDETFWGKGFNKVFDRIRKVALKLSQW